MQQQLEEKKVSVCNNFCGHNYPNLWTIFIIVIIYYYIYVIIYINYVYIYIYVAEDSSSGEAVLVIIGTEMCEYYYHEEVFNWY